MIAMSRPYSGRRSLGRALAAFGLLLYATGGAWAAPQTFNTALPVAEGEFLFRQQFLYKKASDDPSPANRDLAVLGSVSVLGYGVNSDLAVFAVLPVLDKNLRLTTPGGVRVTRDTTGLADVRLFGRYTLYRDDGRGRTLRVAPIVGIEVPTGDDNDRDGLGRLPAILQLGSGSWDPFFGVVTTIQTLDYQIDVAANYKVNTTANSFDFGDEARLDGSLQYRLWPRELSRGVPAFLYGTIDANLIRRGRNRAFGNQDRNSGGVTLFLAPGLQYVTKRWILEATVQVPVFQNLHGSALEDDFTARAGLRINF